MNNNTNIDNKGFATLLFKYLDRVDIKGLTEAQEINQLGQLIMAIQANQIELSMVEQDIPPIPDAGD